MKRVRGKKGQSNKDEKKTKKVKETTDSHHEDSKKEVQEEEVQKEEEEPNIVPPQSTRPTINPLLMDDIVAHVFRFLDLETLKKTRQVSQLWKKEGGKEMLQKSYIRLPPIFEMAEDESENVEKYAGVNEKRKKYMDILAGLISLVGTFQQVAVHIPTSKNFPDESKLLFNTPNLGLKEKCGELKYTKANFLGLFDIIQKLPYLSKLTTNESSAPLVQTTFNVQGIEFRAGLKDQPKGFRDKLRSLKEINYHLGLHATTLALFTKFPDEFGELKITSLKINGRKPLEPVKKDVLVSFMTTIINNPNIHKNWQIQDLDINVETSVPVELYHDFFNTLMSSSSVPILKTLSVRVCGAYDVVRNFRPWETNWHLPLTSKSLHPSSSSSSCIPSPLERLTFLSVECPANKLWPIFSIALQLPCLKTLVIKSDKEAGCRFDRKVKEWNDAGNGEQKLESKSLQVVDLTNCPFFHLRTLDNTWWPNLKCLKIQLQQYQVLPPFGLSHFFKDLSKAPSLERLEFILMPDENYARPGYWDAILCGRMRTNEDEDSPEETRTEFSLENLKNLKSLSLDSRCEAAHDVSDFFIQNALVHLTNLQSVLIHGHKFQKSTQIKLRQTLGPYAAIQLYK